VLARSTAVRLFVERAQQHKPDFTFTEREAPAVADLVARLEGIPLALELAAARVRSLSVADINTRLKDRYKLLTGGARVLQQRQQTLRALVDWSFELLNENEQTVLMRLGIFAGGFDLNSAEEICGVDPIDSMDMLDLLQSLVEKSLVMLDDSGDSSRYRMLETIRDYAIEKLALRGENAAVAQRHCEYYFALAKQVRDGLAGAEQAEWVQKGEAEIDNLRTAIALPLAGGVDAFIAVKFCAALQNFWILRGYASEGRNAVRSALNLPDVQASEVAQAYALIVGACLAESQSDHRQAQDMLETCLTLRRKMSNAVDIASTLTMLSPARLQAGDAQGATAAESEALDLFRQIKHRVGEMISLVHLGQIEIYARNDARARERLEQALAIAKELKHQEAEGACELALCETAFEAGDVARAHVRALRSLAVCKAAADKRGEVSANWWLGRMDLQSGSLEPARARLRDALRGFRTFEMRAELLSCIEDHAVLARRSSAPATAAKLAAAVGALRSRLGLARSPRSDERWTAEVDALRQDVGESYRVCWAEGEVWDLEQAMSAALGAQ